MAIVFTNVSLMTYEYWMLDDLLYLCNGQESMELDQGLSGPRWVAAGLTRVITVECGLPFFGTIREKPRESGN